MRVTTCVHVEPTDLIRCDDHKGSVWVEIVNASDREVMPIHARTPEAFEALAAAATLAAQKLRRDRANAANHRFDLATEMERAG